MNVRELIEELQKLPPEMEVCVCDPSEWVGVLDGVELRDFGCDGLPEGPMAVYLMQTENYAKVLTRRIKLKKD